MKTLYRFRAKSMSGSGDIDRGHKKPPPQTYKGQKSPGLIGLRGFQRHQTYCKNILQGLK